MSDSIKSNIEQFKRKFYLNKLIRGTLLSALLFASITLIFSTLEGFLWFGQAVRMSFLIILLGILLISLVWGVIKPLSGLFHLRKGISDEQVATEVGKFFPEISDKLLNYLQLQKLTAADRSLVNEALRQKTEHLKVIPFQSAVNLRPNVKYLYGVLTIACFFALVSFISPGFLSDSSNRIIQFDKEFERPSPFQFIVNKDLYAFKNEPFSLQVELVGESLPENVYLLENNQRIRLNKVNENTYKFSFPSIVSNKEFQLEAAGFKSKPYTISIYERPEIINFQIIVDHPDYTGLDDKVLQNTGSLIVPEGSVLTWQLNTSRADSIFFRTGAKKEEFVAVQEDQFSYTKQIIHPLEYELTLKNEVAKNKSKIAFEISVMEDERPEIEAEFIPDTITYKSLMISGNIADDYGFRSLSVWYKGSYANTYKRIPLEINRRDNNQQFFFRWELDSLDQELNDGIQVYVSVVDNDRVNGFKESRTPTYYYNIPGDDELQQLIEDAGDKTQSKFDESQDMSESLNEKVRELENRLKNKKELNWQDEKLLDDMVREKEELRKSLEELKKQHEELMRSRDEFGKQSQKLKDKSQQLQELINESMDEETQKLYEELQKLLKEKSGTEQVLEKLSDLKSREQNLEKELERMKELFNRLKFESALEKNMQELEKIGEKQEDLATKTQAESMLDEMNKNKENASAENTSEDGNQPPTAENKQSIQEQQEINEAFKEFEEKLEELEQLNQELKHPEPLEDFQEDQDKINEKLEEIPENLQKGDKQKAGQQMKNAGQRMKSLAQKMGSMQNNMEMIVMQENIDQLRDILDNLIKLSFEQEKLINSLGSVQQSDPRFIELSQEQLKLIDNSEVIEDSLLALASRVVQISNFVTREIGEINSNLDKAMEQLRERNKGKASSHQQFAMTSMNNLSLLLDDVLSQMQMTMSEMMGKPQTKGQQPQNLPNLSELQKQLSEQIQELRKSGKSGRKLSEELGRLAAEQAELRRQLESMKEKMSGQPQVEEGKEGKENDSSQGLGKAIEMMEENELDLVNKQLTNELIERQQKILTRMLEAEESIREQKKSPEREGETASQNIRKVPPEFEEYLKAKRSELELLKTIPLDLNPFYKKEVNNYFRRLSGEE